MVALGKGCLMGRLHKAASHLLLSTSFFLYSGAICALLIYLLIVRERLGTWIYLRVS